MTYMTEGILDIGQIVPAGRDEFVIVAANDADGNEVPIAIPVHFWEFTGGDNDPIPWERHGEGTLPERIWEEHVLGFALGEHSADALKNWQMQNFRGYPNYSNV